MYIDNISLTPFNSEEAITFEGKANGSAVDSSTSVWRYDTTAVAGNNTTKLVFSHTGMASGSVYNDFGDAVAVEKGYYYIIKFDYYIDAYMWVQSLLWRQINEDFINVWTGKNSIFF